MATTIPKIIHQIWIGPYAPPVDLMDTWKRMNPTFRYELWDDSRCSEFGFKNLTKIREQPELAGKADLMRYEILEKFGGIYIDADSECIRPLDDHLLEHDSFACYENEQVRGGLISNGSLGATAGNRLMGLLVQAAATRDMRGARAWMTVGPLFLTEMVALAEYTDLHVYPSHYFLPRHYSGLEYHGDGLVYARQYWGSTREAYGLTTNSLREK